MRKTLLLSSLLFVASMPMAHADETKIDKKEEVSGVGFVRVVHRIPGEPVMSPDRFEVFVQCHRKKREKLVESLSICDLKSYKIEKQTKLVSVTFMTGRTDAVDGLTHCDTEDYKEIKLGDVCKKKKKNAAAKTKSDAHANH